MFGELSPAEIERVLMDGQVARLGITDGEKVYIFPVSYGYDGIYAYVVSRLGLKVRLMRAHPEVCFQVDDIKTPAQWCSVMAHGSFEELLEQCARDEAFALIATQGTALVPPSVAPFVDGPEVIVIYRIRLQKKTGRFERHEAFRLRWD